MLQLLDDWRRWNTCDHRPNAGQVEVLPGGLTNQSFILHLDRGDFVLRLEAGNSRALDIHRDVEYRIHQQAALIGLVPKVLYRSSDDAVGNSKHYWIREYLQGNVLTPDDLDDATLAEIARLLRKLHSLPADDDIPVLSLADKGRAYLETITHNGAASGELIALIHTLLQQYQSPPGKTRCLCHMDPTLGNWIRTARGLQLVDWEYAAQGHPLWDLAAIVQDVHLSEAQHQVLLGHYFDDLPGRTTAPGKHGYDKKKWQYAKTQINLIAALWYGAQQLWSLRELESYLLGLQASRL